jgi:hypothetical protein
MDSLKIITEVGDKVKMKPQTPNGVGGLCGVGRIRLPQNL